MLPLLLALAHAADPLVAVVVIDQEARESGYALQLDGFLVDDAIPLDVVDGDELLLVDPDGRAEPLDVAVGEAWEITGPEGEAWMATLDEEVRTDLIAVKAPYRTVKRLAEALSAEVKVSDGVTYLAAPEVLYDLPWVEGLDTRRLEEVRYVRVDELVDDDAPVRMVRKGVARRAPAVASVAVPEPAVDPVPAPMAAAPAVASVPAPVVAAARPLANTWTAAPEPEPEPVVPVIAPVSDAQLAHEAQLEAYAGLYLCRDQQLFLHPAGIYVFAGQRGEWHVGAPGIARLEGPDGELWYRAAIEPERGFCREVWTEADVLRGQAPQEKRRKAFKLFGPS